MEIIGLLFVVLFCLQLVGVNIHGNDHENEKMKKGKKKKKKKTKKILEKEKKNLIFIIEGFLN